MKKPLVACAAALLGGSFGCTSANPSPPVEPSPAGFTVTRTAGTVSDLPTCTSDLGGTVAFVTSPPSLWTCVHGSWDEIACTNALVGMVAYSTSPPALWACLNRQWTAVALPDAGPGPQGPQGDAGLTSLLLLTPEPPGPNCAAGGQRIDVGLDTNGDGALEPSEVTQTAFVCNGIPQNEDGGGADATSEDAGAEGDATDGGDGSDGKVIPPGLLNYGNDYANAICAGFAACCGANFDVAGCAAVFSSAGWDNTLPLNRNVYGAGNLTFDAGQADTCKAALRNWPCGPTLTAEQNQAILSACHGVLGGTVEVGGTCNDSFECANGWCDLSSHTCAALVGDGGACVAGSSPDEQCSDIATAEPALYCNMYPGDGTSPGAGTCAPAQPDGAGSLCTDGIAFISDYACANRLCDLATSSCEASTANPADPSSNFVCSAFPLPADAGSE